MNTEAKIERAESVSKPNSIEKEYRTFVSAYKGPIPSPEMLKGFESVAPGAAERILRMAEKEQDHRIEMDNRLSSYYVKAMGRGQLIGCSLVLLLIGVATVLALIGYPTLAGTIFAVTIIGIAIIFVLNKEPKIQYENKLSKENTPE